MFTKKTTDTSEKTQNTHIPVAKRGIRKMDTIVTWMLLGGIVASVYGVKRYKDTSKEHKDLNQKDTTTEENNTDITSPQNSQEPQNKKWLLRKLLFWK